MANPKHFIAVGHGGSDPGATSGGLKEADIVLDVALETNRQLKRFPIDIKLSRYGNENDPVSEEVKECNAFAPQATTAIHINAGGGDGCEFWHYSKGGASKTLAQHLDREIQAIGQNSRGLKTKVNSSGQEWYAYIRNTNPPAVIAELAFIDTKDIQIIDEAAERKLFGIAIAKAILAHHGIAWKDEAVPTPPPSNGEIGDGIMWRVVAGTYGVKQNAVNRQNDLKAKGVGSFLVAYNGMWRVVTDTYDIKANAHQREAELKARGIDCFVVKHLV